MEDIFDKLSEVTGITKYSNAEVPTPAWVVKDMVDLLPANIFVSSSKFLDPAVKSGRFLAEIYRRLMDSDAMKQAFPNEHDRQKHILDNQLYGFATSAVAATIVRKQLYDDPTFLGNIHFTSAKDIAKEIQGAFGDMKFDVVIGNPPYNKGMDLDFVDMGFELSKQYTVMIIPAKWQTAEAEQGVASDMSYGEFRKKIVPYMKEVVYFPNSLDVFDNVYQIDGISYFIVDKNKDKETPCLVINKQSVIYEAKGKIDDILLKHEGTDYKDRKRISRDITSGQSLLNVGQEIIDYLGDYQRFNPDRYRWNYTLDKPDAVKVWINNLVPGNQQVSAGGFLGIGKAYIDKSRPNKNQIDCYFMATGMLPCEAYLSYLNSKFVRFFLSCYYSKLTGVICEQCFKFVPIPSPDTKGNSYGTDGFRWDHIYTDQELYQHYNLPQKYIDVIEAIVKERK